MLNTLKCRGRRLALNPVLYSIMKAWVTFRNHKRAHISTDTFKNDSIDESLSVTQEPRTYEWVEMLQPVAMCMYLEHLGGWSQTLEWPSMMSNGCDGLLKGILMETYESVEALRCVSVYESSWVVSRWHCYILMKLLRLCAEGEIRFLLQLNGR